MKKRTLIFLRYAFGITSILSGCQKVIEPKNLPQQDPRLVVNCIIYNDSAINVNISSSKSILSGKPYKYIDNATCVLYEDDKIIEQFVNYKNGNYSGQTFPKANKKYSLKVSASGFTSVEGSTTMADSATLSRIERYDEINSNYKIYYAGTGGQFIKGNTKCKIWIRDNLNTKNYYTLKPKILFYDSLGNLLNSRGSFYATITNNNTSSTSDIYNAGNEIETSDLSLVNGNEVQMDVDIGIPSAYVSAAYAEVYLTVDNINEDLYKYTTTLNDQLNTGASLFAEPVFVFNNIKNGMGIIGSKNSRTIFLYKAIILKN